jgi:hypothetical protein
MPISLSAGGTRPTVIVQFARFWSANMDMVHSKGQSWPGFSYSDDEKNAMHNIAASVGSWEFIFFTFVTAVIAIAISAGCVGLMFWLLSVHSGGDFSRVSGAQFFFTLMLAGVMAISIGMPVSILAGAWITPFIFLPAPQSIPDLDFSRRIFFKASRQIARMGFVVCGACIVYAFFVPADSKVNLFLRTAVPALAPAVLALTALYYYSGRVAAKPAEQQSADAQPPSH